MKKTLETSGEDVKNTLETSGEDVKNTLETSEEDVKNTLETSGEDDKNTLETSEEDVKNYIRNECVLRIQPLLQYRRNRPMGVIFDMGGENALGTSVVSHLLHPFRV